MLDVIYSEFIVIVCVFEGWWFWLDYVFVVFENVYSFGYFWEEFLDKFYDFISYCVV